MTNALRDIIFPKIKRHCKNVYFRREHENKSFPYVVYSFGMSTKEEDRRDHIILMDIWDKSDNPSNAIDLGDVLLKEFDKCYEHSETIVTTFYSDTLKVLDDEDMTLQHVNIRIISQTYEKESEVDG